MLHRATLWDNGTIWCSQTILPWCAVLWWRYAEKRAQQPAMASDPGPRVMMEPSGHNPLVYGSERSAYARPSGSEGSMRDTRVNRSRAGQIELVVPAVL